MLVNKTLFFLDRQSQNNYPQYPVFAFDYLTLFLYFVSGRKEDISM